MERKSNTAIVITAVSAIVLAAAGIFYFINLKSGEDENKGKLKSPKNLGPKPSTSDFEHTVKLCGDICKLEDNMGMLSPEDKKKHDEILSNLKSMLAKFSLDDLVNLAKKLDTAHLHDEIMEAAESIISEMDEKKQIKTSRELLNIIKSCKDLRIQRNLFVFIGEIFLNSSEYKKDESFDEEADRCLVELYKKDKDGQDQLSDLVENLSTKKIIADNLNDADHYLKLTMRRLFAYRADASEIDQLISFLDTNDSRTNESLFKGLIRLAKEEKTRGNQQRVQEVSSALKAHMQKFPDQKFSAEINADLDYLLK